MDSVFAAKHKVCMYRTSIRILIVCVFYNQRSMKAEFRGFSTVKQVSGSRELAELMR